MVELNEETDPYCSEEGTDGAKNNLSRRNTAAVLGEIQDLDDRI